MAIPPLRMMKMTRGRGELNLTWEMFHLSRDKDVLGYSPCPPPEEIAAAKFQRVNLILNSG